MSCQWNVNKWNVSKCGKMPCGHHDLHLTQRFPVSAKSPHAVERLRAELKSASTRPFKARGAKLRRCPGCLQAAHACVCAWRPMLDSKVGFCLIMHAMEPLKPTNTGRLIADCITDTHAFVWSRTRVDPALLELLADPQWQPYVVFPAEYAHNGQPVATGIEPREGKQPLLIILDATWTQARKMFRKSPWLDEFPVLSLQTEQLSRYRLRRSTREEHLCTVEVATACLGLAGEDGTANLLNDYFDVFTDAYLASRGNWGVTAELPSRQRLANYLGVSAEVSDGPQAPAAPAPEHVDALDK
jgi:DTW domain-containing protein YfiP